MIEKDTIVDAISGTTGAGRRPDFAKLHMVQEGNFKAYGVAGHRHTPEIEQSIEMIGGAKSRPSYSSLTWLQCLGEFT